MPWATTTAYKTRLRLHPGNARAAPVKPLDNDMPSSPVPFIIPSSLVTFQHDLKALITSSPLLKFPLTMRPLMKKRSSIPFTLALKRHPTTIFARPSPSSSDVTSSADCTPTSEMADPISMTHVTIHSRPEMPLHITPCIGAKIMDKFWPEEEAPCSGESYHGPAPNLYPVALAPPPHHRRAPRSLESIRDVSISDPFPPQTSSEHDTGPLRFPF